MKILSINNNYQPRFGINLSKKEGPKLIKAALSHDEEAGIAKLYTLLALLDKIPGNNATLKTVRLSRKEQPLGFCPSNPNIYQLRIDGKLIGEDYNLYNMLYSAITSKQTEEGEKIPMPQTAFDAMWRVNTDKTEQDIEQFLKD